MRTPGDRDHRGHHERDDGIEPVPAGDRDERPAPTSTPTEVSMSVGRCAASAASAAESVASARVRERSRDHQVDDDRHGEHRDADAEALHAGALRSRWRTASNAMTTQPTRMSTPSMAAAMFSIFSWP